MTSCANPLKNYMVFNQADGIYTYAYEAERNPDCVVCNQRAKPFEVESLEVKLQQVLDILTDAGGKYQMRGPGMTTVGADGKSKTLYMANIPSLEAATKPNLKKTLEELGVGPGAELVVADATSPNAVVFKVVIPEQQ